MGSMITYLSYWYFNQGNPIKIEIPSDIKTLNDIAHFLDNKMYPNKSQVIDSDGDSDGEVVTKDGVQYVKFPAHPVAIQRKYLKEGDIVKLKNSQSAFLVYDGCNNDRIILKDALYLYECDEKMFSMLFTGKAIVFHNPTVKNITQGNDITDDHIYDPNIKRSLIKIGQNYNVCSGKCIVANSLENSWSNAESNSRIVSIAQIIVNKSGTSEYDKFNGIWNWMHTTKIDDTRHMNYRYCECTAHNLNNILDTKSGNCAE